MIVNKFQSFDAIFHFFILDDKTTFVNAESLVFHRYVFATLFEIPWPLDLEVEYLVVFKPLYLIKGIALSSSTNNVVKRIVLRGRRATVRGCYSFST